MKTFQVFTCEGHKVFGKKQDGALILIGEFQTTFYADQTAFWLNRANNSETGCLKKPPEPIAQINIKLVEVGSNHLVFMGLPQSKPALKDCLLKLENLPLADPKLFSQHFEDWFTLSLSVGKSEIEVAS